MVTQVRFLPPQLSHLTLLPSNFPRVLGRSAEASDFQSEQAGSIPAGHSLRCVDAARAFEARRSGAIPGRSALTMKRRSSSCWSLHLALNEEFIGSIPVSGAVAVLYWFQELGCEPGPCRFNSDRSPCVLVNALESTWWWNLIVDQVAASSILVRSA